MLDSFKCYESRFVQYDPAPCNCKYTNVLCVLQRFGFFSDSSTLIIRVARSALSGQLPQLSISVREFLFNARIATHTSREGDSIV